MRRDGQIKADYRRRQDGEQNALWKLTAATKWNESEHSLAILTLRHRPGHAAHTFDLEDFGSNRSKTLYDLRTSRWASPMFSLEMDELRLVHD